MEKELEKKYIVWVYTGHDWSATGYDTLEEAIEHECYGSEKMITSGKIKYKVKEVEILA